MGVPLWRAWEICRLLDDADAEDARRELDRAVTLTTPTATGDPGTATRRALRAAGE